MSDPGKKLPISVYDAYDAVESCAKAYYEASKVVRQYHGVRPNDGRYEGLMNGLKDAHSKLQKNLRAMKRRRPKAARMVESMKRDIHRACAHQKLVEWDETSASSVAEGILAITAKVLARAWDEQSLTESDRNNQRILLLRAPSNHEKIVAMLNLEAARVVELQESKGADLSRLSPIEKRVYCAVEVHGPINEKGLNQLLYGKPTKGDARRHAAPMVRHGLLDVTSDGYIVRQPGNIVRTDVS